jgi:subtilisin family serine protease
VLIGFLISSYISSIVSSAELLAQSLDDPAIKSKFEPWLWEKVQKLEANGTTRFMAIGLGINCTSYEHNVTAAYDFKTQVATHVAQEHNATITYIGRVLSFIDIRIRVPEIKKIALYEFIDRLSDAEARGTLDLDVSTTAIRSSVVVNEVGYNGSEVRVAVLDTGINASHSDFAGKDIIWEDFVNGRPTPYDDHGHGTHCAGIIAGTGQASNKIYGGVAPGVTTLIIGKMANQQGSFQEADARASLDWAVSNGSQVISCSWSVYRAGGCDGHCLLCEKVDECVSKGVVVVKSAGNRGESGPIGCPGNAFNVITVGAINDHGTQSINDDTLLPSSSRGPTEDGRPKPDIVAPGWNIMCPDVGGGYSNFHYTSAATPHVSGVAALLLQAHPGWTPGIVKSFIKGTARLNDNLQQLTENDRGKGIVDAERALRCSTDIPTDEADSKSESGSGIYVALANLNGTYIVSAEAVLVVQSWAEAVLFKSYTPEEDMVNPTFYFGFVDIGVLIVYAGSAYFDAKLKLWEDGKELFAHQETIHALHVVGAYETGCCHAISYQYDGVLLAGHTYDIEYGFYAYATTYLIGIVSSATFVVQALSLSILDILGPGNPSFEQRLQLAPGVFEVPYWSMNKDGWRELRGDVDGDKDVDIYDITSITSRYGAQIGDPEYDPILDLNGDGIIDIYDVVTATDDYGKQINPHDGSYSWFTDGGGIYYVTQWLCDYDVNALKGKQVTFTFWFKPQSPSSGEYTRAEIYYMNGTWESEIDQAHINGTWVSLTGADWNSASVTTPSPLPDNTIAIKVIIYGRPNFKASIDDVSVSIQS